MLDEALHEFLDHLRCMSCDPAPIYVLVELLARVCLNVKDQWVVERTVGPGKTFLPRGSVAGSGDIHEVVSKLPPADGLKLVSRKGEKVLAVRRRCLPEQEIRLVYTCLLYTSDAADEYQRG